MKIKTVINYLESIAPPMYQENYDNAGLIVGNAEQSINGVLICLDSTEAVVEEAIAKNCNLIVAHHPIVFKGLKKITGKSYVERVLIKAIQNEIAIYAIHTNLDNVYFSGVNAKIAEKIELINTKILAPKGMLNKLFAFSPIHQSELLKKQLFEIGAGVKPELNQHSYATLGVDTSNKHAAGKIKMEITFPNALRASIVNLLTKENIDYDIIKTENKDVFIGSGMIGELKKPMEEMTFLKMLKKKMKVTCIRYTQLLDKKIKKVALCGGAGGFLLGKAIQQRADIFITADYKYHEFFDADQKIIIADIGHYESEQFTIELIHKVLSQKFSNFAAHCTEVNTNPVHYLC